MKKGKCVRCNRFRELDPHHIYRRNNNRDAIVYICRECHIWVGNNIAKAKKEGLYLEMDGEYRKKPVKKNKWSLNFKNSGSNKWQLKKKIANDRLK